MITIEGGIGGWSNCKMHIYLFVYVFVFLFICLFFFTFVVVCFKDSWQGCQASSLEATSSQVSWCFSQSRHQLTSNKDPTTRKNKGFFSVLFCSFYIHRKGHYPHTLLFTKWSCFMRPTSTSTSILSFLPYHNFHFLSIFIHFLTLSM